MASCAEASVASSAAGRKFTSRGSGKRGRRAANASGCAGSGMGSHRKPNCRAAASKLLSLHGGGNSRSTKPAEKGRWCRAHKEPKAHSHCD
ncbi:hypothetical protein GCM10009107_12730 [Ideonella azotifigens]|uniref:Uncharacterized protein n=2 Tax=Ideonella azotifigens TaxID=513160 RepID=A0ABN1JT93_9BURK